MDIKACPYCSDKGRVILAKHDGWDEWYAVSCCSCDMQGPLLLDRQIAIVAWNSLPRMRWIPVEEGLPEIEKPNHASRPVIVAFKNVDGVYQKREGKYGEGYEGGITWLDQESWPYSCDITHWMEFPPEPPEAE